MPIQARTFAVPLNRLPRNPGARNLLSTDLAFEDILRIDIFGQPSAQTTLEQLAEFLSLGPFAGTRAIGIANDGYALTDPIVSPKVWTIRDIIQTPAKTTCSVVLDQIPSPVPTGQVQVRIDAGMHGVTKGAYPCDNQAFTLAVGATPWTFELAGSTFVAGSIFKGGRIYVDDADLVDAAADLNELNAWATTKPATWIMVPLGGLYAKSAMVRVPPNCIWQGHGGRRTFLFAPDYVEGVTPQHVLGTGVQGLASTYPNVANVAIGGVTLYGNRTRQPYRKGYHALDCGGDSDTAYPLNLRLFDLTVIGSGGYGASLGGGNSKVDCDIDGYTSIFSDGDAFDLKNKLNGNRGIRFTKPRVSYWAMGAQGTNLSPQLTVPNDGITITAELTDAGDNVCTIARNLAWVSDPDSNDNDTRTGETVTLSGATTFNGVDFNGSFNAIRVEGDFIYFDCGQVASGTGAGGGGSVQAFIPHISVGDCILDTRGLQVEVVDLVADGELFQRNGLRQRGGLTTDGNGEGATNCIFTGVNIIDRSPAWVAGTDGAGRGMVTLLGTGASVSQVRGSSTGGGVCISVGSEATEAVIDDVRASGIDYGIRNSGERCKFANHIYVDPALKGFESWGYLVTNEAELPADPFHCATVGTNVVIVSAPDHGKLTGQNVRFRGAQSDNGITIRRSNEGAAYSLTVIDANSYSIVADGSSTATTDFGGDSVTAVYQGLEHDAKDNEFYHITVRHTDPANTAVAWSLGESDGNRGRCSGNKVAFCHNDGCAYTQEDFGTGNHWIIGNTSTNGDAWNNITGKHIEIETQQTDAWVRVATWDYDAADPPGTSIDFQQLLGRDLQVRAYGLQHSSGSTQNWRLRFSDDNCQTFFDQNGDYERDGDSAGTDSFVFAGQIAASTPINALVEIYGFNASTLKGADIEGGAVGAATAVSLAAGATTFDEVCNGLRILCAGAISGGRIEIYAKVA